MYSTTLSPTVRSWMKDKDAFIRRMAERADQLWESGYTVEACEEVGTFRVICPGPNGQYHLVNILTQECSCPYQTKHEIPTVKCKHLLGIARLIEEQYQFYWRFAQQHKLAGRKQQEAHRRVQYHTLLASWNAVLDALRVAEYEARADANNLNEVCALDEKLRNTVGAQF